MVIDDCENGYIHDIKLEVNIMGQMQLDLLVTNSSQLSLPEKLLIYAFDKLDIHLPTFPLNTDGIDIVAKNFTVRRVKMINYDDAVVPKPGNQLKKYAKCSEDILVEDIESTFGIGMAVGSVAPHE